MNDKLRLKCKELKILQDISYSEIADQLKIKRNSFYNWMKGYYDFSQETQERLLAIILILKE